MRNTLVTLGRWLMAMGFLLLVASCDIEMSDNGKLDGLWQLTAIDTLSTNGHVDMRETNTAWAIQGKVLELYTTDLVLVCEFSRDGDVLKLGTLRLNDHYDNEELEDVAASASMGVNEKEERFNIMTLTSSTMVLQSSLLKLSFRKY